MADSVFIFLAALILLGPKKLPQLARQLGKLMAEFRKASNDFRMQMEDELRLEEQKEHQAKVAALQPPTPAAVPVEDPPHPHLPAPVSDAAPEEPVAQVQPIAESGELKMMPPSSGLPMESSVRTRSYGSAEAEPTMPEPPIPEPTFPEPAIPEHSIGGSLEPTSLGAGASSEEPAEELPPPPDRSQPAMVGQGERATHV